MASVTVTFTVGAGLAAAAARLGAQEAFSRAMRARTGVATGALTMLGMCNPDFVRAEARRMRNEIRNDLETTELSVSVEEEHELAELQRLADNAAVTYKTVARASYPNPLGAAAAAVVRAGCSLLSTD